MRRNNKNNNSSSSSKTKRKPNKGKPSSQTTRHHKKVEIKFDADKRVEYLTGFSARKKERRAFGLAMQKVKDRQAKIEERKDNREAQREKVEEIERSKAQLLRGLGGDDGERSDEDNDEGSSRPLHKNEHTFQDEHTQNHFGGLVSVTTTFGVFSDDEESTDAKRSSFFDREKHGSDHVDMEQKQAGNVQNYIAKVKGTMGGKQKKTKHNAGKKGQHGAANMKGMGGGTTLKMAKKTLAKFKAKGGEERDSGRGRGKKRKGRR